MKCEVVSRYSAMLVDSKDVPDMAAWLGNPMLCEVKQPDEERKQIIKNWWEKTDSDKYPKMPGTWCCGITTSVPWRIR
jgi:hypothetical protein